MIRSITNISGQSVLLSDYRGKTGEIGETFDGLAEGDESLRASSSIANAFLQGWFELYDGFQTYSGLEAVRVINGASTQFTKDGKQIFTASDRPKNHYRHYTGRADDVAGQVRGKGAPLLFNVGPQSSQVLDFQFIDDVYIKDGRITYQGASYGSHVTIEIMCPAGVPFPAPNGNGNRDLVDGTFVENTEGTGAWMVLEQEVLLNRFVNEMHICAPAGREGIDSVEPFMLNHAYKMRATVHNSGSTNTLEAALTISMYRKNTL